MIKEISFRDAKEGDFKFLYKLHRETLKEYIDQTWGWDENWQVNYFREKFNISGKKIIMQGGVEIGCLTVQDMGNYIFLSYIALMPAYQNQGIGTRLIEEVLEKGHQRNSPVKLKVLKKNPAHELYRRLGFKVTETSNTHYFMSWDQSSQSS